MDVNSLKNSIDINFNSSSNVKAVKAESNNSVESKSQSVEFAQNIVNAAELSNNNSNQNSNLEDSSERAKIDEEKFKSIIDQANEKLRFVNKKFSYKIHEKTNKIMVKIVNSDTGETIREIPPEKELDMVAKMQELAGILVDERR